jgi:hypothetical protein
MRLFARSVRSGAARRRSASLHVEALEDRATPANLAVVSAQLVTASLTPTAAPVLGEAVFPQVVWSTTGLAADAQHTIDFAVDGVTVTPPAFTYGTGASGTQTFSWAPARRRHAAAAPGDPRATGGARGPGRMTRHRHTVEETRDRLERAGWSVQVWPVPLSGRVATVTRGGHQLLSSGPTEEEALRRACRQAEARGLLATNEGCGR